MADQEAVSPAAASPAGWRDRSWRHWVPVAAYAGLIFYLSSQSSPPGPAMRWLELVGDKGGHAAEFGLLGILCYRAFRFGAGPRAAQSALLLAILASIGYGITDEIHQAFVPLREPSPWDVLADGAGASVASSVWRRLVNP